MFLPQEGRKKKEQSNAEHSTEGKRQYRLVEKLKKYKLKNKKNNRENQ